MTHRHTLGGTLLVAGTCIGAGTLALPISSGPGGFFPSLVIFALTWLAMCGTGLLFLEISLWMGKESNIVSMAGKMLGVPGKVIAWLLYLFLFYSLTVAYISGTGELFGDVWWSPLVFVAVFAPMVYIGALAVDRTNLVLVVGLGLSYVIFVILGLPHVKFDFLTHTDWLRSFAALPIILTSFGFQGLVPSLTTYLQRNAGRVRFAIIVGSLIPFAVYILWQFLVLGIIPFDELAGAQSAISKLTQSPAIKVFANFFAFFALTSSFLGVSLGLRDFLADALKIKKDRFGRFIICSMIFLPALAIVFSSPHLFILLLTYGGGTGMALLLGLLPIVLVWIGRYRMGLSGPYQLTGGRFTLVLIALFIFVELAAEILL